jgi:hypothetical protein
LLFLRIYLQEDKEKSVLEVSCLMALISFAKSKYFTHLLSTHECQSSRTITSTILGWGDLEPHVDVVELNSWTGMHILIVSSYYSGSVYLTFIYSTVILIAYALRILIVYASRIPLVYLGANKAEVPYFLMRLDNISTSVPGVS